MLMNVQNIKILIILKIQKAYRTDLKNFHTKLQIIVKRKFEKFQYSE